MIPVPLPHYSWCLFSLFHIGRPSPPPSCLSEVDSFFSASGPQVLESWKVWRPKIQASPDLWDVFRWCMFTQSCLTRITTTSWTVSTDGGHSSIQHIRYRGIGPQQCIVGDTLKIGKHAQSLRPFRILVLWLKKRFLYFTKQQFPKLNLNDSVASTCGTCLSQKRNQYILGNSCIVSQQFWWPERPTLGYQCQCKMALVKAAGVGYSCVWTHRCAQVHCSPPQKWNVL